MSRLPLLLLLHLPSLLLTAPGYCQSSVDLYGSARADALANGTTAAVSAVGVHANPAARATAQTPTASFYAREAFRLSPLRYGASHVLVPLRWGTMSAGASTFGFEKYREIHLSGGYARSFSFGTTRRAHLGMTARFYHTSITSYGRATALALNAGFLVSLLHSLTLGAHATNVNGSKFVTDEAVPRTLAVGLRYQALSNVTILADIFKDVRFSASVRGGVEVRPVPILTLRAGVTTAPTRFTAGSGIRLGPLRANVAVEQHQVLGWSPSASLEIQW